MRVQTPREEVANAVSHGVGFLAASAGIPLLVVSAARHGGVADIVGGAIFGAAMVLLYLTSTVYHALPPGTAKGWFRRLDHSAIYFLIAGTYTPFTLGVLGGGWGWSLFGVVWGLAAIGIAVNLAAGVRWPAVSVVIYVAMGWLIVVAIRPLLANVPGPGIALLFGGGAAYTLGVAFYVAPRLRWAHLVWHLFVLTGTTLHFFAVLRYAV